MLVSHPASTDLCPAKWSCLSCTGRQMYQDQCHGFALANCDLTCHWPHKSVFAGLPQVWCRGLMTWWSWKSLPMGNCCSGWCAKPSKWKNPELPASLSVVHGYCCGQKRGKALRAHICVSVLAAVMLSSGTGEPAHLWEILHVPRKRQRGHTSEQAHLFRNIQSLHWEKCSLIYSNHISQALGTPYG